MCSAGTAGPITPQYGFFTEHATETSATNHTFTRPDALKTIQGADGNTQQTIKKAFSNPENALVTSGTYSGNSDQRLCGVGQFAQTAPPGTTVAASYANPAVLFPAADSEGNRPVRPPPGWPPGYECRPHALQLGARPTSSWSAEHGG